MTKYGPPPPKPPPPVMFSEWSLKTQGGFQNGETVTKISTVVSFGVREDGVLVQLGILGKLSTSDFRLSKHGKVQKFDMNFGNY